MKIIFFGTGKFGIPTLKRLLSSDHEVLAVVTQPDRKKGRGYNVLPTPVKAFIEKAAPELDILQPEDAKAQEFVNDLKGFSAALFIVVDYGQKLSNEVLETPEKYCINLHPSLLPEYRGASPINKVILDGKTTTGNTVFKMAEKMDAGEILLQEEIKIFSKETAVDLAGKLSLKGADIVLKAVDLIAEKKEVLLLQDETKATYAHKIQKKDGEINWQNTAIQILDQIRAFQPWPGAYTYLNGKMLKVNRAIILDDHEEEGEPGMVFSADGFLVATGEGTIQIKELQLEGKKAMTAGDFLLGTRIEDSAILGK